MISSEPARVLLVRKSVETLAALFALVFLSFLFLYLMPGGPFDEEVALNPEIKQTLLRQWALDRGFFTQFLYYLLNLFSGSLGMSMNQPNKKVVEIIFAGASQTFFLNMFAVFIVYASSFSTSILLTLWTNSFLNPLIRFLNIVAVSLPALFLGPVLIYTFGFYLQWLPTAFLKSPLHYVLPLLTLSFRSWGQLNLLLAESLRETMKHDFIRTAKAKGLSHEQVILRHAFKNSLIPILSVSGPTIVGIISGSFLVEILFSIPGLGQQFVESLNLRDYPVIMGLVLLYGCSMILLTNVFDVISKLVDPRISEVR
ncbi:MAG: ABC transporter permease [Bdellovibrionaceae bacterium]|nr:ABC transporter permease [Pseudobdellovibrionaceae bacterium]